MTLNNLTKKLAAAVLTAVLTGTAVAQFANTPTPVSPAGVRATIDLPVSRHLRNVGGSDGAGLCVYTSTRHSADWANLATMLDFRKWAQSRPGGADPDKLDSDIHEYCRQKNIPVPAYVQHTGGDEKFLELALRTGRSVGVTYSGNDNFYGETIAHMVNLVHLDADRAAIIDNNRPGNWVWMSRKQFLDRWRGLNADGSAALIYERGRGFRVGGGWAFVFLASPPPPYETLPGKDAQTLPPNGVNFRNLPNAQQTPEPPEPAKVSPTGHGVNYAKIAASGRKYSLNGHPITAAAAEAVLTDDSDRYSVTAVGDANYLSSVRPVLAGMDGAILGKVKITEYTPDQWQVGQFGLKAGVTVRKPGGRVTGGAGFADPTVTGDALKTAVANAVNGATIPPSPLPTPMTITFDESDLTDAGKAKLKAAGVTKITVTVTPALKGDK